MKLVLFVIVIITFSVSGWAQTPLNEEIETLLLQEEPSTDGLVFKPVIGAGLGAFSFFGDVNDYFRTPLNGLTSVRLSISRNLGNYYDLEFQGTFGNVTGNQYNGNTDEVLNFKTSLFMGGVSVYYNFNHILKRQRPIHPYISIGAEMLQFTPKADLVDRNKNTYHYWSDGTIRDIEQGLAGSGNLIQRDYEYESDLRSLDLYDYGYYSKTSFAIPIDLGVNVTVSDRVMCRLGATLHVAMTDYIDNYKGASGFKNDIVLNTYVALTFDLFSPADELVAVENFKNLKFTVTDGEDSDGDKVDDFNDECPGTPAGVKVNYKGCPEDQDNDGVPDYMDKQLDTPSGTIAVSATGIRLAEAQLIVMLYDPEAVKRSEIKLYTRETRASNVNSGKGIPEKFKQVDTNEDNYVSHEELQKAIDSIFEGNSTLTPSDIYQLQEFFFNQ